MSRGIAENTTRLEWLTWLAESYAKSAPFGGNTAILIHLTRVHSMGEPQWLTHRAELLARDDDPWRRHAISQMADELLELRR